MGKIIILDENTANKIAAGEVIERPASVIKELVENSIDAGATNISVEIRNGGISFIRVIDNGSGLAADDVEIAFERHATSKIRRADDLESISSMGFRGEALASIAAVSHVQLLTRTADAVQGVGIEIRGGSVIDVKPAGCPTGTSFTVRELFFNTPARYKFMKKDTTEAGYVADVLSRVALGYPDVSFKLVSGGATLLHTPGNGDLKSTIFSVYGAETARQLIEVQYDDGRVRIGGYIGKAELSRSNRSQQSFYINRRYIRSKTITSAIDAAYSTFLMKNRYAFALLDLRINPALVDVNVHPSKMEVKFSNEQDIYRAVFHSVNSALLNKSQIRTLPGFDTPQKNAYHLNEKSAYKEPFAQQQIGTSGREADSEKKGISNPGQPYSGGISSNIAHSASTGFSGARKQENRTISGSVYSGSQFEPVRKELEQIRADAISGIRILNEAKTELSGEASDKSTDEGPEIAPDEAASKGSFKGYGSDKKEIPDFSLIREKQLENPAQKPVPEEKVATSVPTPGLFSGTRIVGQVFSTYILLEREEELLLLDQHAAHERIRYEELKEAFARKESLQQTLLSVVSLEMTGSEYQFATSETAFFEQLGFTYESFGTNSIILRTVPFSLEECNVRDVFLETLDFVIRENGESRSKTADEVLYRMACKSAVKANKRLEEREIEALLAKLAALENPYTCPHGRPAILKLRRYELEKLFKRIV